jgi:pimeloyl-ACP methyl ester carboxylesterase
VKRVLRLAVIVVIALVIFAQYVRRTGMFFPEKYPLGNWEIAGAHDEWLTTSDGVKLHGWLFRATDPQAPLLLFFHGNAGNITVRGPIAAELARRGVSTFVFDWRGYGRSDGSPSESRFFDDAEAAYAFATKLAPHERIALYGESLGGPYAAWIAKKHGARCIVLDSTFPSLRELGNALYFPFPLGWSAPFALRTRDWVNDANVPALVMHSHHDDVIPFRLGQSLFDGLHVQKTMYASDARGHCAIEADDGPKFYDAVVTFIQSARPSRP